MIRCDFLGLFIGFLVGVCLMTIISEEPEVVVKYPTPYNTKAITYVDDTGNCYQYKANKMVCPTNNEVIKELPVNI
jgi:hypothetical protein